jgi:hypothetical protein
MFLGTGGHLRKEFLAPGTGPDEVVRAAVAKHFSLWKSLMTRDNLARVEGKLRRLLAEDPAVQIITLKSSGYLFLVP